MQCSNKQCILKNRIFQVLLPAPHVHLRLAVLEVASGSSYCQIDANGCVTEGVGVYSNGENCIISSVVAGFLTAMEFNTEASYDFITIGANAYSGTEGPRDIPIEAGSTFTWRTDGLVTAEGWTICLTPSGAMQS